MLAVGGQDGGGLDCFCWCERKVLVRGVDAWSIAPDDKEACLDDGVGEQEHVDEEERFVTGGVILSRGKFLPAGHLRILLDFFQVISAVTFQKAYSPSSRQNLSLQDPHG